MAKLVHFIDTLPGAPYTESNLQASEVRKCRANRPRSRHCNRQNGCRQPGCPPKLQRTLVLREKEPSPTLPRHLAGFFLWCEFCRTLVDANFCWYRLPFPRCGPPPFFFCASLPCGPRQAPGPRRHRLRLMKSSTRWDAPFESPLRFHESSRWPRVSPKRCTPLESRTALSAIPSTATILPTPRKRAR